VNSASDQINKNITAAGNNPALKDQAKSVNQYWAEVEADATAVIGATTDDARTAARDQEAIDLAAAQYYQGLYNTDVTNYTTAENAKLAAAKTAIQRGVKEVEDAEAAKQKAHAATAATAHAATQAVATATAAQPAAAGVGGSQSPGNPGGPNTTGGSTYTGFQGGAGYTIAAFDNPLSAAFASWISASQRQTAAILANTAAWSKANFSTRVNTGSAVVDTGMAYGYVAAAPGLS
jgi:hypothetical protein